MRESKRTRLLTLSPAHDLDGVAKVPRVPHPCRSLTRPALDGVLYGTNMAGDIHIAPLSPQTVALLEKIDAITGKFDW